MRTVGFTRRTTSSKVSPSLSSLVLLPRLSSSPGLEEEEEEEEEGTLLLFRLLRANRAACGDTPPRGSPALSSVMSPPASNIHNRFRASSSDSPCLVIARRSMSDTPHPADPAPATTKRCFVIAL